MKEKTAKEIIKEKEWFRSEYFINPKTGDIYDCYRPAIYRCVKGLQRFIDAQDKNDTYQTALQEIKEGKKKTHWIWFIFPQMAGLGKSEKADFYGIIHRGEAMSYMEHPILSKRLIEVTEAVYNSDVPTYKIFGNDTIKVYSCMKLFSTISDNPIFKKVLDKNCWR